MSLYNLYTFDNTIQIKESFIDRFINSFNKKKNYSIIKY